MPSPVNKARKQPDAYKERANLPDTTFRKYVFYGVIGDFRCRFYERGDLPIQMDHGGVRNMIAWKVDITKVKENMDSDVKKRRLAGLSSLFADIL